MSSNRNPESKVDFSQITKLFNTVTETNLSDTSLQLVKLINEYVVQLKDKIDDGIGKSLLKLSSKNKTLSAVAFKTFRKAFQDKDSSNLALIMAYDPNFSIRDDSDEFLKQVKKLLSKFPNYKKDSALSEKIKLLAQDKNTKIAANAILAEYYGQYEKPAHENHWLAIYCYAKSFGDNNNIRRAITFYTKFLVMAYSMSDDEKKQYATLEELNVVIKKAYDFLVAFSEKAYSELKKEVHRQYRTMAICMLGVIDSALAYSSYSPSDYAEEFILDVLENNTKFVEMYKRSLNHFLEGLSQAKGQKKDKLDADLRKSLSTVKQLTSTRTNIDKNTNSSALLFYGDHQQVDQSESKEIKQITSNTPEKFGKLEKLFVRYNPGRQDNTKKQITECINNLVSSCKTLEEFITIFEEFKVLDSLDKDLFDYVIKTLEATLFKHSDFIHRNKCLIALFEGTAIRIDRYNKSEMNNKILSRYNEVFYKFPPKSCRDNKKYQEWVSWFSSFNRQKNIKWSDANSLFYNHVYYSCNEGPFLKDYNSWQSIYSFALQEKERGHERRTLSLFTKYLILSAVLTDKSKQKYGTEIYPSVTERDAFAYSYLDTYSKYDPQNLSKDKQDYPEFAKYTLAVINKLRSLKFNSDCCFGNADKIFRAMLIVFYDKLDLKDVSKRFDVYDHYIEGMTQACVREIMHVVDEAYDKDGNIEKIISAAMKQQVEKKAESKEQNVDTTTQVKTEPVPIYYSSSSNTSSLLFSPVTKSLGNQYEPIDDDKELPAYSPPKEGTTEWSIYLTSKTRVV